MSITLTTAEAVALEVARRVGTITKENGYETDIGRLVFRGKRKIPADEQMPASIITEGDDEPKDKVARGAATYRIFQTYVIDGFDHCDPDNPNDQAHKMLRDIKRAILGDGGTMGDTVRDVMYRGRDIGPRPDGHPMVQARVVFEVEYVEDLSKP